MDNRLRGGSVAYPSNPERANFSSTSLQNFASRSHEKQNIDSARGVTRLANSPFSMVGSPSQPRKHFGSPSRVNSVKARQ